MLYPSLICGASTQCPTMVNKEQKSEREHKCCAQGYWKQRWHKTADYLWRENKGRWWLAWQWECWLHWWLWHGCCVTIYFMKSTQVAKSKCLPVTHQSRSPGHVAERFKSRRLLRGRWLDQIDVINVSFIIPEDLSFRRSQTAPIREVEWVTLREGLPNFALGIAHGCLFGTSRDKKRRRQCFWNVVPACDASRRFPEQTYATFSEGLFQGTF